MIQIPITASRLINALIDHGVRIGQKRQAKLEAVAQEVLKDAIADLPPTMPVQYTVIQNRGDGVIEFKTVSGEVGSLPPGSQIPILNAQIGITEVTITAISQGENEPPEQISLPLRPGLCLCNVTPATTPPSDAPTK